jgi:hypothetical protein
MNINTMVDMINNFNQLVVESGFLRDIQEYIKAIAQPQNSQNIVLLKDITSKTKDSLNIIYNSDLPDHLKLLIPGDQQNIFTNTNHLTSIDELISDPQINTAQYHAKLNQILNNINSQVSNNQTAVNQLNTFITPYYKAQSEKDKISNNAVLSLIFKNPNTIKNLKQFSSSLMKWNRAINLYHQLVSPKSPRDVELISIQNGSIDVIVNLDVNVAINFTEIVKYGLEAFIGYLTYKANVKDIVKAYFGNKKLIEAEKEREKELLNNIGLVIENKMTEQHKRLVKEDPSIKPDGPTKIANEVTKIIAEHIVSGNDIKLLIKSEDKKTETMITETTRNSLIVRSGLKQLSNEDKTMLLDLYTVKEDIEEIKHEESKPKKHNS